MDTEFIKWLAGMGTGGAIAGLIFYFYRKDVRSYTELWRETASMLHVALEKSTSAHAINSETNREVINLLQALHRRLDIQHVPPAGSAVAEPRI